MRSALLFVAVLAAPFAIAQDAVMLKRVAKEGETSKYKLLVDTEFSGMKIKFTANVIEKILKFDADGSFSVSSEQQEGMLDMDGQTQPAPAEVGTLVTTSFLADGSISDIKGDSVNADAFRLSNLQTIFWPKEAVQAGSKWQRLVKADTVKGSLDVTANYEITGREKVGSHDCFKITFDAKEQSGSDPAGTKGTMWIDVANGLMVKNESDWTNMPIAGQVISGKVKMELAE